VRCEMRLGFQNAQGLALNAHAGKARLSVGQRPRSTPPKFEGSGHKAFHGLPSRLKRGSHGLLASGQLLLRVSWFQGTEPRIVTHQDATPSENPSERTTPCGPPRSN